MKILDDAGHGGEDRHNVGYSKEYVEADGTLTIALAFQAEMFNYEGVEVDLTRNQDKTISLTTRGLMANGYDLFISDHTNAAGDPDINGVEGFYSVDLPGDKALVDMMCEAIAFHFDIPNRGAKVRPGVNDPTEDYYTVIDKAQDIGCKHVILMEYMFHSNPEAEKILLDDENLRMIGKIKAQVVAKHFGLKLKNSKWEPDPKAIEWALEKKVSDCSRLEDAATRGEIIQMLYNFVKRDHD